MERFEDYVSRLVSEKQPIEQTSPRCRPFNLIYAVFTACILHRLTLANERAGAGTRKESRNTRGRRVLVEFTNSLHKTNAFILTSTTVQQMLRHIALLYGRTVFRTGFPDNSLRKPAELDQIFG